MHFGDLRAPGDETHQGATAGEGRWGGARSRFEKDLGLVIPAAQREETEGLEGERSSGRGEFLRKKRPDPTSECPCEA